MGDEARMKNGVVVAAVVAVAVAVAVAVDPSNFLSYIAAPKRMKLVPSAKMI